MKLKSALKTEARFAMTLQFEKAGPVAVDIRSVQPRLERTGSRHRQQAKK